MLRSYPSWSSKIVCKAKRVREACSKIEKENEARRQKIEETKG